MIKKYEIDYTQIITDINISSLNIFQNLKSETCQDRQLNSIFDELYKRFILPLYTLIISLIAASLIVQPKSKHFFKFHKMNIFLLGSFIIIISQIGLKFILGSEGMFYFFILLPLILVMIYYFLLLMITRFKLNFL